MEPPWRSSPSAAERGCCDRRRRRVRRSPPSLLLLLSSAAGGGCVHLVVRRGGKPPPRPPSAAVAAGFLPWWRPCSPWESAAAAVGAAGGSYRRWLSLQNLLPEFGRSRLSCAVVASSDVNGDESDFNYIEDSGKGPEDWWRRKECWRVCKQGNRQSPIELKEKTAFSDSSLSALEAFYESNHAILKNRGHDVMLRWPDGGGDVNIDGVDYTLKQCHWHSPAEHIIDGSRADLELHMVHRTSDDRIAIVAILYKISGFLPDPFLNKLIQPLKVLGNGKRDHVRVGKVDPVAVKGHWPYFRYVGSLTTPPCTQDVVWTVYKEVLSVSHEQLLLLRHAVHDNMKNNSRPVQPINDRWISFYLPRIVGDQHPSS